MLRDQILQALASARRPYLLNDFLRHVTATQHTSRILSVLQDLERHGQVSLGSDGWV